MPLIELGPEGKAKELICLCGKRSNTYDQHHMHLVECELDRCAYCKTLIGGRYGHDPAEHQCPAVVVAELRRRLDIAERKIQCLTSNCGTTTSNETPS